MSLTVAYLPAATAAMRRLREDDPVLFRWTRTVIRALAADPYPTGAVPWGTSGIWRLHASDIRVLYEVDEQAGMVYIAHVGRVT